MRAHVLLEPQTAILSGHEAARKSKNKPWALLPTVRNSQVFSVCLAETVHDMLQITANSTATTLP
jgi:hypothetical protein